MALRVESRAIPGLAEQLLGDVLLAESLADARRLHQAHPGCRVVTRAGELLEPDGTLTVGPPRSEAGLVSRKSELRELSEQFAGALRPDRHHRASSWPSCVAGADAADGAIEAVGVRDRAALRRSRATSSRRSPGSGSRVRAVGRDGRTVAAASPRGARTGGAAGRGRVGGRPDGRPRSAERAAEELKAASRGAGAGSPRGRRGGPRCGPGGEHRRPGGAEPGGSGPRPRSRVLGPVGSRPPQAAGRGRGPGSPPTAACGGGSGTAPWPCSGRRRQGRPRRTGRRSTASGWRGPNSGRRPRPTGAARERGQRGASRPPHRVAGEAGRGPREGTRRPQPEGEARRRRRPHPRGLRAGVRGELVRSAEQEPGARRHDATASGVSSLTPVSLSLSL